MKRTKKQPATTSDAAHDLLTEPSFRVRRAGLSDRLTLPGVLAALGDTPPISFTELQPHQTHPWYAFLVQLAAIALHRAGEEEAVRSEDEWRTILLALTEGAHEPWCLVVPDLSKPAFMQPPIPEGTVEGLKREIATPDDLDVLVTAKNHDVKMARVRKPSIAHWVHALIDLQTFQGFYGRDNWGIVRMNSGLGNRPCLALTPTSGGMGARFRRDTRVLMRVRDELVDRYNFNPDAGKALIWLEPWSGGSSLPLKDLDPFFIEICRRVRMVNHFPQTKALIGSTKVPRISASELTGDTGDAWTPVKIADGRCLTLGPGGFHYSRLQELLLSDDWRPGAAQLPQQQDDDEMVLAAWALVRGQGKTEGLHERRLRIPKRVRMRLGRAVEREELSQRAKRWVERAGEARLSVLKPALCVLLQGNPEKLNFKDERPQRWLSRFDKRVDAMFFPALWDSAVDESAEVADQRWTDALKREASAVLNEAIGETPMPTARRYRAIAGAERVFGGAWSNRFGASTEAAEPKEERA